MANNKLHNLLSYLKQLPFVQHQLEEQKTANTLNMLVSDFTCSLNRKHCDVDQLNFFLGEEGPSTIVEVLYHPFPTFRSCAKRTVSDISRYCVSFPQEHICIDILLEFFSKTERTVPTGNFQEVLGCRQVLMGVVFECMMTYPWPSVSQLCKMFIDDLVGSYLRQFTVIQGGGDLFSRMELNYLIWFIVELRKRDSKYADRRILNYLIRAADDWLSKISNGETPICGTIFLLLLTLQSIAQYDHSVHEKMSAFYSRRHAELNMIIQGYEEVKCSCDTLSFPAIARIDQGLFCDRTFLTFDSRRVLAISMLALPTLEGPHIIIGRNSILEDSFKRLRGIRNISKGISIEFSNEVATGPGVMREWFYLICKELFNPSFGLFTPCPEDKSRFFPHHGSGTTHNRHLAYFKFCGQVIALALREKFRVDVKLARFFFNRMAGRKINWEDVKDADPQLYKSYKEILEMEPEAVDELYLTFDADIYIEGSLQNIELIRGGKKIPVTSENRLTYVTKHLKKTSVEVVDEQISAFVDGFSDVLDLESGVKMSDFLDPLELLDLDMMMFGRERDICVLDWKLHTEYHDYTISDKEIQWFWQVVEEMENHKREQLLYFSTSIRHLPAEGFSGLSPKFNIHKIDGDFNRLPTAHTCFYQLNLPPYPSYELMHYRIHTIVADHLVNGGFGLQ